jgi:30S ribosomal protein S31
MGKGDKRSRKGKIHNGTYGKRRPARMKKAKPVAAKSKKS